MTQQATNGKTIRAAFSSMTRFSCEFDDGTGLILEAVNDPGPKINQHVVDAATLPRDNDAVCKVDWGWLVGNRVKHSRFSDFAAQFQLDKAGLFTISVKVWQGKPFLAFQPFRFEAASLPKPNAK